MTDQLFSLIPFPTENLPDLIINGRISRRKNRLFIHYAVSGSIDDISLPASTSTPARKDELWRRTCFEFFIAGKDSPQYWEFNMSPTGEWNVYAMNAYRQVNMREETRIQRLQFKVHKDLECFSLDVEIDLSPIIANTVSIDTGITSVIQANNGMISYWALLHPHVEADFHLRKSFILEFP